MRLGRWVAVLAGAAALALGASAALAAKCSSTGGNFES